MKNKNTFQEQVVGPLQLAVDQYAANNAFCINSGFYSYQQFAEIVSAIRAEVEKLSKENINVGLVANDDIETYAAIIALWLEGKCYVPVNPETPAERNRNVLKQAEVSVVIDPIKTAGLQRN
jgi:acyl-CoA synthetase (AMP-forming)/AMP-acid ligase II